MINNHLASFPKSKLCSNLRSNSLIFTSNIVKRNVLYTYKPSVKNRFFCATMMASLPVQSEASPNLLSPGPEQKKIASVYDVNAPQPPKRSRYLTEDSDVWSKNAWDYVPPPDDQHERIASSLARQQANPVPEEDKANYNEKPAKHWDNFYKMNADNFFRNRKWLPTEFPELIAATQPDAGPVTVAELGCGAGNSVFPLLAANQNPDLELFAFDYSNHAVKLVQRNELYESPPIGSIRASVWDLASPNGLPDGISPSSVDIVLLIFVLSALHPNEWAQAVSNIYKMLKPGGLVVMRDYGRHDMAQLRFKEGRLLDENFYIRGDKTRVFFFEPDDLAMMFTGSPAQSKDKVLTSPQVIYEDENSQNTAPSDSNSTVTAPFSTLHTPADEDFSAPISFENAQSSFSTSPNSGIHPPTSPRSVTPPADPSPLAPSGPHLALQRTPPDCPAHPLFEAAQLGVDHRLLVNRKRQIKMYRVWMQGKFRKLLGPDEGERKS